jgi:hypothetical protein
LITHGAANPGGGVEAVILDTFVVSLQEAASERTGSVIFFIFQIFIFWRTGDKKGKDFCCVVCWNAVIQ